MKKILMLSMVLVSLVSYGQSYGSMSYLWSPKTYMSLEIKSSKYGGIGNDWYDDKVIYDESFFQMAKGDYNSKIFDNKRESMGLYYVSPSYKNFDVIIGFGTIRYSVKDTWQTGDYVNGYYRSNGTYVNGYYRNVRNVSEYVEVDRTNFLLFGISKSVRIYPIKNTEDIGDTGIYLHTRGVIRNLPKYGNEELGRELKPQLQIGIKVVL